ncbi:MAG: Phosphoserine phosphatase RsbU [Anaerolineales bacterium]|nr:Phosphoserine phosphatase RsbU [Anaerolineales bacterium]
MKPVVTRLYDFGLGLAGLAILISLPAGTLFTHLVPLMFFAGLSLVIKRFGFRVFDAAGGGARHRRSRASEVTHSLVGIVDLSALLIYGPVFGGWVAVLSEFTLMVRRPRWTWRTLERWETALFNAGLKALMALAGGAAYTALGGHYQPVQLTTRLLLPLAALFLVWFGLDHLGWSVRVGLKAGVSEVSQFLQTIILWSLLVELVPLPMSVVLAVVYASLGWSIFLLLVVGFVVTGFIIQRLMEARRRLRSQVTQLSTISEVSRQVAAIPELEDLFRRVVELIQSSFEYDHVRIFTRESDAELVFRASTGPGNERWRELDYRVPVGEDCIVGWVAERSEPLLVNDVSDDPRYAVDKPGLLVETQAELAVPLQVEDRVVGVLDVQNTAPGTFDSDDLFVLQTLGDQIAMAIEDARLYEQALERERLEQELNVALGIQTSLLPASLPDIAGWDIAGMWQPARNVAGDFYDFIPLRDGRLGILIADVSDKGVPAALFMAVARTLLRAMAIGKETPAAALQRANDLILADARTDMFVTVFYVVLDPDTSAITYVNAGHVPPLLYRSQTSGVASLHTPGIALGVIPDIELEQRTTTLAPGDLIVLCTDGITEAVDDDYEGFGEERLARLILEHHDASAGELVGVIEDALRDFVGPKPPFDDQALLVLKRVELAISND